MEKMAEELQQTRLTKTFPEEIFIQADEWTSDFSELDNPTFSDERVNQQDVKYIREDLVRRK